MKTGDWKLIQGETLLMHVVEATPHLANRSFLTDVCKILIS